MCNSRQPAVNRVELKGLGDLNTPVLPSSLSARTMGCFPLFHHPSLPTVAKISADRKAPPTAPPLLSACVHSLPLSLSASIGHYLTFSILSIEENPPTSPPAEQPHCHQSTPILGGDWYHHLLPFSLHCLLHPAFTLFPLLYLPSCSIFSFFLSNVVFL